MTVIATAGHVDHGKSSLVRAMCGTDPDRLAEEKRRGMTIELGFAHCTTADGTVLSFVDVPGHSDFVRTMVSGVSGVDIALLVIDVNEGWMPHTQEHLGILDVLGVSHGLVALTKCDRADADTVRSCAADVTGRLSGSSVTWHGIINTSSVTGEGMEDLENSLAGLAGNFATARDELGRPRLFVDRAFTIAGAGTVVTGTLGGSELHRGSEMTVARTGRTVRVRDIQTHGSSVGSGRPGSRCAVNVSGAGTSDVRRGDALVGANSWQVTPVFDATFSVLTGGGPLKRRRGYSLHVGTNDQLASVRVIGGEEIAAGGAGLVRVRFDEPLPLTPGDRFLLRDPGTGTTIGGGVITDVDPRERISRARPDGSLGSQVGGRGWIPVDEARRLTGRMLDEVAGGMWADDATIAATREYVDAITAREHGDAENDPIALRVRDEGVTPEPCTERDTVRRLVQRGILFEHDGIAFHRDVLDGIAGVLTALWDTSPGGFTMSQLREALGITRKHAVPLATCLDKRGWTRRSGDVRTPGPRARTGG
jgi:selenocysteine-specific elongation factor